MESTALGISKVSPLFLLILVLGFQRPGWKNVNALLDIRAISVSNAPQDIAGSLLRWVPSALVLHVNAKEEVYVIQKLVTVTPEMRIRIMTVLTVLMGSIMTLVTLRGACHVHAVLGLVVRCLQKRKSLRVTTVPWD